MKSQYRHLYSGITGGKGFDAMPIMNPINGLNIIEYANTLQYPIGLFDPNDATINDGKIHNIVTPARMYVLLE